MAIITTTGYLDHDERVARARDEQKANRVAARGSSSNDLTIAADGDPFGHLGDRMLCAGNWTAQAMCRSKTALFFAPPGEREGRRRRREALASAYCAVCPVQEICKLAGRQGREHGIWGGENDEERAAMGFAPRSPHRRAVAEAARQARLESAAQADESSQ